MLSALRYKSLDPHTLEISFKASLPSEALTVFLGLCFKGYAKQRRHPPLAHSSLWPLEKGLFSLLEAVFLRVPPPVFLIC